MNAHETEIRGLTVGEIEIVAGGGGNTAPSLTRSQKRMDPAFPTLFRL